VSIIHLSTGVGTAMFVGVYCPWKFGRLVFWILTHSHSRRVISSGNWWSIKLLDSSSARTVAVTLNYSGWLGGWTFVIPWEVLSFPASVPAGKLTTLPVPDPLVRWRRITSSSFPTSLARHLYGVSSWILLRSATFTTAARLKSNQRT